MFATFDALGPGQHFVLANDHDPIPLKHPIDFVRKGQVGWGNHDRGWSYGASRSAGSPMTPLTMKLLLSSDAFLEATIE